MARAGGVLALLAASLGAKSVTVVEQSPLVYRQTQQLLAANPALTAGCAIDVVPCRLHHCVAPGLADESDQEAAGECVVAEVMTAESQAAAAAALPYVLPQRAHIYVTDLFDSGVLGGGVLQELDYAATNLLHPSADVIPESLSVRAALLDWRVGDVEGFNLSAMNRYLWHPQQSSSCQETSRKFPFKQLGAFEAQRIDLQGRTDALQARQLTGTSASSPYEHTDVIKVQKVYEFVSHISIYGLNCRSL